MDCPLDNAIRGNTDPMLHQSKQLNSAPTSPGIMTPPPPSFQDSAPGGFTISIDTMMNPESHHCFSDFPFYPSGRKQVPSIKMEDDDVFTSASFSGEELENIEMDVDLTDMESVSTISEVKTEIEDPSYDIPMLSSVDSENYEHDTKTFQMTEAEARKHIEQQFQKIAFVPNPNLNQRNKIEYILAQSDCTDFTAEEILNFDKRSASSARACAKIVQNIPQRYRWECVKPEDIPCCYTIVADCKKVLNRDKPPRPMNAFMIWAQGARRLINELCPKMQNALISEALGFYWRQKSDQFKKQFEQEKINLRQFHNVEFPAYKYKPKTKVQKAKEKQELSLTKAKIRATVKKEKIQQDEESNLYRRRTSSTKCGRPRKTKTVAKEKEPSGLSLSPVASSELPVKMSPTKPAIKDKLTLKILNDRRSKAVINSVPKNERVNSAFGQLSPLEVVSPGVGDIFDDLGSVELVVSGRSPQIFDDKARPPSVYDTPANTPPVDSDDDLRLSPIQPQPALVPTSPPAATQAAPSLLPTSSSTTTTIPKQILMPSLSAMLASPARSIPCSINSSQSLQLVGLISKSINLTGKPISTYIISTAQQGGASLPIGNGHILHMTAPKTSLPTITTHVAEHVQNVIDVNNNDEIKNITVDNNIIGPPPSYAESSVNSRLTHTSGGPNDLDTLLLDFDNSPLSDADFTNLMETLCQ